MRQAADSDDRTVAADGSGISISGGSHGATTLGVGGPSRGLRQARAARHPGAIATQRIVNECLGAQPVGYGTNDVPNPPYIDDGTA